MKFSEKNINVKESEEMSQGKNNIEQYNVKDIYKESAIEKNNKKISIRIFIIGIIISCILCGIGGIRQNDIIKTNEKLYNEAYALGEKKTKAAEERIKNINVELEELNTKKDALETEKNSLNAKSDNWYSESSRLAHEIYDVDTKIMDLAAEKDQLLNADYTVYYSSVKPIKYLIFYYIGAGVFVIATLIALIYFLVTRKK